MWVKNLLDFDVADRMRKSLRVSEVSVQEMAEYLGVQRNSVGRWINGHVNPSRQTLRLWALRTGVPFEWLETGRDARNPRPDGPDGGEECAIRDSNPEPADYEPQPSAEVIPLAPRRDRSAPLTAPASTPEPLRVAS